MFVCPESIFVANIKYLKWTQISGGATDVRSARRARGVRGGVHLLQRHRGLHGTCRTLHARAGGGSAQRPLHDLRRGHRAVSSLQGMAMYHVGELFVMRFSKTSEI